MGSSKQYRNASAAPVQSNSVVGEQKPQKARPGSPTRKSKFCMYHLQGVCAYGSDCAFAHSCSEMQAALDAQKTRSTKNPVEDGRTGEGRAAKTRTAVQSEEGRSTTNYKRTLCTWNAQGKCRNGPQCRFAHGEAELRLANGVDWETNAKVTIGSKAIPYEESCLPRYLTANICDTNVHVARERVERFNEPMKVLPLAMKEEPPLPESALSTELPPYTPSLGPWRPPPGISCNAQDADLQSQVELLRHTLFALRSKCDIESQAADHLAIEPCEAYGNYRSAGSEFNKF